MAFRRRLLVALLLLFFLVGLSTSRTIKTRENDVSFRNLQHQENVKDMEDGDEILKIERLIEGRKNLELTDYPGTGANNNHDPSPPGKRV